MAETPEQAASPAAQSAQAAPAPSAPSGPPELAAITAQMEQARAAATEQARIAAETGVDPSVSQREQPAAPATPPPASREPSESTDQAGDTGDEAPEDGTDASAPPDPNAPPKQWSRKDAPRLAQRVEELSKTNDELRGKQAEREQADQAALVQFARLIKTPDEYRALELRARDGDFEARQELEVADAWRQMATPLFSLARQQADHYVAQVEQAYKADLHKLTTLDGVDEATMQKITASRTPGETLRVLYDAGRAAEKAESKGRITALETEIADLRRQILARGPQLLVTNGSAGQPGSLANMRKADGTLDEATIQRALNGEFVGVGVEKPTR